MNCNHVVSRLVKLQRCARTPISTEEVSASALDGGGQPAYTQPRPLFLRTLVSLVCGTAAIISHAVNGAEPLHQRIDALVTAAADLNSVQPIADDSEFVRRIYLDLAGRIPSHEEYREFLQSTQADKRELLIDSLLTSVDYPRRMQELFSVMLLERRGDNPEWASFLRASFAANKPWDTLVREIISPNMADESVRGAAFFHTKRLEKVGEQETDYPGLTRDVGRLFLGMDLQCAQCHNHLFIDSYKQQDFQGLFIAFQNVFIRNDVKFPAIAEKPIMSKLEFMSVFEQVPLETGLRLPGGKELDLPLLEKGQEYDQPPDKKTNFPGVPKFKALEALAVEMTQPQHRAFVDNIANRLWFVMMGRGLVNPLDQHHIDNPPSHPQLLELLGMELVEHKFDMRWMLREIALSDTYQLTSRWADHSTIGGEHFHPESYRIAHEKHLSAEQICRSILVATGPVAWTESTSAVALDSQANETTAVTSPDATSSTENQDSPPLDLEKLTAAYVKAFANPPQDPEVQFNPSLKAALFLMNDEAVLSLLVPRGDNLVGRLIKTTNATELATELYACVLTRQPSDDEQTTVLDYLSQHSAQRESAVKDLVWALLASTEFCLNH
jgi:hypothetical protein